jgi:hypothetical protein
MGMHQILRSEAAPGICQAFNPAQNPPGEEARHSALIEDYLDHFCAPLVGTVPYERRQELRRELTCHLESIMDALQELGATRDEAVLDALHRFGDPQKLGAQWAREWSHGTPERLTPWAPMRITMGVYSVMSLVLALTVAGPSMNSFVEFLLILSITALPVLTARY